jgi:hypothetical protein
MKRTMLATFALLFIGLVAFASATMFMGPQSSTDRQAIETAIANNDFATWKTLEENQLTQANFDQIVQQHQKMADMQTKEKAVRDAVNNNDYDSYLSATQNLTSAKILSESDFAKLAEIRQARQNATSEMNMTGQMHGQGQMDPGIDFGFGNRFGGGQGRGFDLGKI